MGLLLQLLALLLPFLFEFLGPFLRNLMAANADDPPFLDAMYQIVRGINDAHPGASNDDKYDMAFSAAKVLAKDKGKELKDSAINALIEMAVLKLKAAMDVGIVPMPPPSAPGAQPVG
jgi:hypothetical protein